MKPTLLIMAAGMGSRYGGVKQIDPLGPSGETIIDYSVYDAVRAGFGSLVFVIRRDLEKDIRERFGRRFEKQLPLRYVFQELEDLPSGFIAPAERAKPWGTGQAVLTAAGVIDSPFAVINADDFYGSEAFSVMASYLQNVDPLSRDYSMVGYTLRNTLSEHGTVSRGICTVDSANQLVSLAEHTKIEKKGEQIVSHEPGGDLRLTGDEPVSMNFFGFTPRIFSDLQRLFREFLAGNISNLRAEFYFPKAVDALVQEDRARLRVLRSGAHWFGVTYKEDKPAVQQEIRRLVSSGLYPESLWPQ